jgi:hypothetical protein
MWVVELWGRVVPGEGGEGGFVSGLVGSSANVIIAGIEGNLGSTVGQ